MLIHKFRKDEMLYFSIYSKVKRADTPESKLCACLLKWAQISPLFFYVLSFFQNCGGDFFVQSSLFRFTLGSSFWLQVIVLVPGNWSWWRGQRCGCLPELWWVRQRYKGWQNSPLGSSFPNMVLLVVGGLSCPILWWKKQHVFGWLLYIALRWWELQRLN